MGLEPTLEVALGLVVIGAVVGTAVTGAAVGLVGIVEGTSVGLALGE